MLIDVRNGRLKELLSQPNRFSLEPALNTGLPVLSLLEQELAVRRLIGW